jgi:AcrR family transcriptional regulator
MNAAGTHLRPGTAVHPKGRERTEAILAAAKAVLVEEGYAAFTLRKVATRAGMSLGNLQYYYRAKTDVVRALLARSLASGARAAEVRLADGGDARDALAHAVRTALAEQETGDGARLVVELEALAGRDPEIAAAVQAYHAGWWRALVYLMQRANPELGRATAGRRAALAVALLEGLGLFRPADAPRRLPLPGLADEAVAAIVALAGPP